MRTRTLKGLLLPVMLLFVGLFSGCSNDDDNDNTITTEVIGVEEKAALLFMLEEEKMARDVYYAMDTEWDRAEFKNIARSEESHMAAVENLLKLYKISYTVLPEGEFQDGELQQLYDALTAQGSVSLIDAYTVGATIEDLDIYDLETYLTDLSHFQIEEVFANLQCGSRNHLRAFSTALNNLGVTYTPQFISENLYSDIINTPNEKCNP